MYQKTKQNLILVRKIVNNCYQRYVVFAMYMLCLISDLKIILQGIVAMQLRCGEIFNNRFIVNCPHSVRSKNFENWLASGEDMEMTKCKFLEIQYILYSH